MFSEHSSAKRPACSECSVSNAKNKNATETKNGGYLPKKEELVLLIQIQKSAPLFLGDPLAGPGKSLEKSRFISLSLTCLCRHHC